MESMEEMMKAAQEAAQKIQQQMSDAQVKLDQIEVEGSAGGGLVKVRASARGRIIGVSIDDSLFRSIDEGADVINLSLGGSYSPVIHNAIKKARNKGVIVVAAAGNSGRKGVGWPGALEETIDMKTDIKALQV